MTEHTPDFQNPTKILMNSIPILRVLLVGILFILLFIVEKEFVSLNRDIYDSNLTKISRNHQRILDNSIDKFENTLNYSKTSGSVKNRLLASNPTDLLLYMDSNLPGGFGHNGDGDIQYYIYALDKNMGGDAELYIMLNGNMFILDSIEVQSESPDIAGLKTYALIDPNIVPLTEYAYSLDTSSYIVPYKDYVKYVESGAIKHDIILTKDILPKAYEHMFDGAYGKNGHVKELNESYLKNDKCKYYYNVASLPRHGYIRGDTTIEEPEIYERKVGMLILFNSDYVDAYIASSKDRVSTIRIMNRGVFISVFIILIIDIIYVFYIQKRYNELWDRYNRLTESKKDYKKIIYPHRINHDRAPQKD